MADVDDINCATIKLSELEFDNSLINQLNDYCLLEIFSYLTIADFPHVEKVCKRWEILCEETWKTVESLQYLDGKLYLMRKYYDGKLYKMTSENDVKQILRGCGKFIKYFHQSFGYGIKLTTIFELCENLQDITIICRPDSPLSPMEIRSIANNCKHLERLTLTRIDGECEKDLSELLSNSKNLKYFLLEGSSNLNNLTGEFLQYLPADVIEEIHLKNWTSLNSHFFVCAMKQFSNLRIFTYGPNGFFDDSMMEVIGQKKTLIKLSIHPAALESSDSINYLGNLTNLEELKLGSGMELDDKHLKNISNNCKQLKLLEINSCNFITNEGIASVANLKQLEIFQMDYLTNVTDEPIGNLPNSLKSLICYHCNGVKDEGVMTLIKKAPNLAQLNLEGCSITNSTIETAIDVTRKRTNDIVLEMYVDGTNVNQFQITRTSPFLKIYWE